MRYVFFVVLSSCARITPADRALNAQNKSAGEFVARSAESAEVRQAGEDIRANSETLERNVFGPPEQPVKYSPQESASLRKASEKERKGEVWSILLNALVGFLLGGGAVRILQRFAPFALGGPAGSALRAMIEAVARVRGQAQSTGTIGVADLLLELEAQQKKRNVQNLVAREAHRVEQRIYGKQL